MADELTPPTPRRTYYRVDVDFDGGYHATFDISIPGRMTEMDLSTARVGRRDGATNKDREFQQKLYVRIGAITVAGGHVEAAMKRLLLTLQGNESRFSLVDKTWSDLHKALVRECDDSDPRRRRLKRVLNWGEDKEVKQRRDDAIHAYWWNYDDCGVVRSRFYRREDGVMIIGSLAKLEEDADLLFKYAVMLDDLLGEEWMEALLPSADQ